MAARVHARHGPIRPRSSAARYFAGAGRTGAGSTKARESHTLPFACATLFAPLAWGQWQRCRGLPSVCHEADALGKLPLTASQRMAKSTFMQKDNTDKNCSYRPYTTKFDKVVNANELDSVLGQMTFKDRKKLDDAWNELQVGLLPWRTKLLVNGSQLAEQIRARLPQEQRESTVVSLLFDQSGSMRGQKMLFSAATADVTQEFLTSLGFACEVLGFTTSRWRGGRSRRRWNWRLSPRSPGRLNDLLHVIYRDASDNRVSTGGWAYRHMLRPDFPKENIDGEAIEWAVSRLRDVNRTRKILIVLSDGAPVDDSTINENGPNYLGDHLRAVVERLVHDGKIEVAAFGIGFATHSFYPMTHHVDDASELGTELLRFLTELLVADREDATKMSASGSGPDVSE